MSVSTNHVAQGGFLRGTDLLWIVGLSLVVVAGLRWVASFLLLDTGVGALWQVTMILLLLVLPYLCILFVIDLVVVRWRGHSWCDLGLRPTEGVWYLRAIYLGIAAYLLIAIASIGFGRVFGELPTNPQFNQLAPAGTTVPGSLAMALMVCLVAPLVEEVLFRGIFYTWLRRRWGVLLSALVSGLCFSLLHRIPWLIPAITVLGVLFAVLYEKSGSLWPCILAHAVFNSVTVVLLYIILAKGGVHW